MGGAYVSGGQTAEGMPWAQQGYSAWKKPIFEDGEDRSESLVLGVVEGE